MVIAAIIAGYIDQNIDSALIVGFIAGFIALVLSGFIAPHILAPNVAALFPFKVDFSLAIIGAIVAGIVALIFDVVIIELPQLVEVEDSYFTGFIL